MGARPLPLPELSPDARIDAAKRLLVEAIDQLVEARLAKGAAASDWVDQDASPLGRDRHLRLVRRGVLPATKDGNRRLVRRVDLDAYLEAHPIRTDVPAGEEDDVQAMVKRIEGGRR